ncbi:ATP-grasp domain-containing protein [Streptomyces bambusae]|uniref:ATP-grasp domain-containing protein n=1 Tax=Streptomyces bambusae TaxID=1550616 RepID=UPI001CFD9332|nr:ATP-grasp domain-containing protein [Streptomyces bambusae]MCB5165693.1 ATP-grasp domain-containing protein [Streptomyces bambusae]
MTDPRAPQRLLMVMPYHQLVRKAVAAGFRVWSIWDPALQEPAYLDEVERHSEQLLLADFSDETALRALIAETAQAHGVDLVLHLGAEASMPPVFAEAEALGLSPNPAAAVRSLNDKAAMRRMLNAAGLSPVDARRAATVCEVREILRDAVLPVIVKPATLAGSRGVALIRRPEDVDEWAERVCTGALAGPYLVEDYLEGPEFSVETLSAGGVHTVVGITAKQTTGAPGFVETGHVFPAPLAAADRAAVEQLVTDLLDLAGYAFGPAHTEVILTAAGPRIVESQARLGGDRIPLLIQTATGFDIEAWIFRALAGEPVAPPAAERYAAIEFFRLPPGVLASVTPAEQVLAAPDVHALHFPLRTGDRVKPVTDSATRHGYAVVDAATPAAAAARLAELYRTLAPVVAEPAPLEGALC